MLQQPPAPEAGPVDTAPLDPPLDHPAPDPAPSPLSAERLFDAFVAHHGAALCGPALGSVTEDDGRPERVHANVILRLDPDGRVTLRALGAQALASRSVAPSGSPTSRPPLLDLRASLPAHATLRYATRPLAQIRHLVVHHSGADARLDAAAIALEHVRGHGWPGIGYHFVIDPDGGVAWCQDLGTACHHVAQFNPAAVGIALLGDLRSEAPPAAQLAGAAALLAWLCADLGLPAAAVRGHGELVGTDCPGPAFLRVWKAELTAAVSDRLRRADGADVESR